MARTFNYVFTEPANTSITVTTEDNPRSYTVDNGTFSGYRVTNISGTFNGRTITGPLASNNTTSSPNTLDNDSNGGVVDQAYNNVIWLSNSSGNGSYSFYGIDNRGLAFSTQGGADERVFSKNSSQDFYYDNSDPTDQNMTLQSSSAPCFASGTTIRTVRGDVTVEALQIGDRVVTASGEERPIRWIGHTKVACRHAVDRARLLPVRIAAHAFGEGRPARDLLVSPGHAICVDLLGEVLIPAIRLVNGTTVAQVEVAEVTYWHVELESHDILLAEGLPAESYLDMGNRAFFEVASIGLGPDAPAGRTTADFCRPFHEDGALVEAVRARLQARAGALGWRLVEAPMADLHLVVDGQTIHPDTDGLVARFILPAEARDVRLVSEVSVPAHVRPGTSDDRRLGVCLAGLTIDDGLTGARAIDLDDARLETGLHPLDTDGAALWRWTDGVTPLPASLWEGCRGTMFLRVSLAAPALPRWVAPQETVVELAAFRRRA
ncbi:Hint domain-containing protein [Methylorubrum salsuginis]|uniref:Hint domain-containing protein n=1 Tax=Methylorubrum salsuginis TaxID=414703 RepID=A0A1I3Z6U6_9HYPH|nr:Hint domain-containing protein [Methylorubrum salsuginis]